MNRYWEIPQSEPERNVRRFSIPWTLPKVGKNPMPGMPALPGTPTSPEVPATPWIGEKGVTPPCAIGLVGSPPKLPWKLLAQGETALLLLLTVLFELPWRYSAPNRKECLPIIKLIVSPKVFRGVESSSNCRGSKPRVPMI